MTEEGHTTDLSMGHAFSRMSLRTEDELEDVDGKSADECRVKRKTVKRCLSYLMNATEKVKRTTDYPADNAVLSPNGEVKVTTAILGCFEAACHKHVTEVHSKLWFDSDLVKAELKSCPKAFGEFSAVPL